MAEKSLLDLVRNGTMDAEVAATLSAIAEEKRSFKVVAVPRFAGKTTVANAMLGFVPRSVPLHYLSGCESEIEDLRQHPDGGYLVVGEFSKGQVPTYYLGLAGPQSVRNATRWLFAVGLPSRIECGRGLRCRLPRQRCG